MSRATHIAFISEHASATVFLGSEDAGGQNVYVDEVSRNLGRLGYRVDVFTRRDNPNAPEIIEWAPGVRVVNLDVGAPEFMLKDKLWPLMPAFRDALIEFMLCDGVRYDLLHGNFWMSGWVAAQLRRQLGIPAVQIFHALGETKRRHQGEADTSPDERIAIERGVIRDVDRLIAQCPAEDSELVDDYGADPAKVVVIPSATNIAQFWPISRDEARRYIGLKTDEPIVVYVGRMLPRKDVRNLIRAAALVMRRSQIPFSLLLVGGEAADPDPAKTPEIEVLQSLARQLGIRDRVRFTGKRQPHELRYYYSAGDIAVTTPWYEPFGLTPLEAMACGRPVIGSAVGGIKFTVQDGRTGCLVPPRDPEALANCLQTLLEQPALRQQMGQAARARVEREFTWPMVAERTAHLYESLLTPTETRPTIRQRATTAA